MELKLAATESAFFVRQSWLSLPMINTRLSRISCASGKAGEVACHRDAVPGIPSTSVVGQSAPNGGLMLARRLRRLTLARHWVNFSSLLVGVYVEDRH